LLALSSLGLTQNTVNSTGISVPHLIKFSGVVKDEAGAPKSGIVGITFAFYKDQQGGGHCFGFLCSFVKSKENSSGVE
jgi:hypothetical protein